MMRVCVPILVKLRTFMECCDLSCPLTTADVIITAYKLVFSFLTDVQVKITWIYEDGRKHVGYIGLDWLRDNCYNTSMSYSQRMKRNCPPVTVNNAVL